MGIIPKGLKVGDKFTDNNSVYEVLEVKEYGYISKLIQETETEEELIQETETEPKKRGRKSGKEE